MKTPHLLLGLAVCGLLSGCAHGPVPPASAGANNASQPANVAAASQPPVFSVVAQTNGAPLAYQWQFNGAPIVSPNSEPPAAVAMRLANEKALALYHCQPFRNSRPARFVDGRWIWEAQQGYGLGDIHARVEIAADGSTNKVDLQFLGGHNQANQPFLKRQF